MKIKSLSDLRGPCKPSGDQLNYQLCPTGCSQSWNFYINPVTGGYDCKKCGYAGFIDMRPSGEDGYGAEILQQLEPSNRARKVWVEDVMMPEWQFCGFEACRYLNKRGINQEMREKLGIVEMRFQKRVLIPYFLGGQLVYWTARDFSGDLQPKYLYPEGLDKRAYACFNAHSRLMIVEGVFDAIHVSPYFDAIAIGGTTLTEQVSIDIGLHAFDGYTEILVVLDGDALHHSLKVREELEVFAPKVTVRTVSGKDPASTPIEEIAKL